MSGPFWPDWFKADSHKLHLLVSDPVGIGHDPGNSALPTAQIQRLQCADVIFLVIRSDNPWTPTEVSTLTQLIVSGLWSSVVICYTHTDALTKDEFEDLEDKKEYVLHQFERVLREIYHGQDASLQNYNVVLSHLREQSYFFSNLDTDLSRPESDTESGRTISQLQALYNGLRSICDQTREQHKIPGNLNNARENLAPRNEAVRKSAPSSAKEQISKPWTSSVQSSEGQTSFPSIDFSLISSRDRARPPRLCPKLGTKTRSGTLDQIKGALPQARLRAGAQNTTLCAPSLIIMRPFLRRLIAFYKASSGRISF